MTEPTEPSRRKFTRRKLLVGTAVTVGVPVAATAWGYDPDWLNVQRHEVEVPGLQQPLKAIQVSDLHADRAGSCSQLLRDRVAEQVRRESADLILATGDYITRPGDAIDEAVAWVASLPARLGYYAVLGNHDSPEVKQALEAAGIAVLTNTWTMFHGMALAGVGDLSRWPHAPQTVLGEIPRGTGTVLLAHQPDSFWTYDEPITLQISGHTHGGQATLFGTIPAPQLMPHLKPLLMHIPKLEPIARRSYLETQRGAWSGFFRRPDGSTLYVNRGLGRFKRISFYCPPELTVWELVPA
ncbi:metallophosphoesterase [Singulisphaera sp. Ch08]|uniref:Metallophosphoesterase n=1 Tax=Singulisphaera sp. Ch08 TaxID=3120278 RepID=A0AAU7C8L2_9BACT